MCGGDPHHPTTINANKSSPKTAGGGDGMESDTVSAGYASLFFRLTVAACLTCVLRTGDMFRRNFPVRRGRESVVDPAPLMNMKARLK
jgi:hypothetical protein